MVEDTKPREEPSAADLLERWRAIERIHDVAEGTDDAEELEAEIEAARAAYLERVDAERARLADEPLSRPGNPHRR